MTKPDSLYGLEVGHGVTLTGGGHVEGRVVGRVGGHVGHTTGVEVGHGRRNNRGGQVGHVDFGHDRGGAHVAQGGQVAGARVVGQIQGAGSGHEMVGQRICGGQVG